MVLTYVQRQPRINTIEVPTRCGSDRHHRQRTTHCALVLLLITQQCHSTVQVVVSAVVEQGLGRLVGTTLTFQAGPFSKERAIYLFGLG